MCPLTAPNTFPICVLLTITFNYIINSTLSLLQNGYVECDQSETCPPVDDCYILVKKSPGECCGKCRGRVLKKFPNGNMK